MFTTSKKIDVMKSIYKKLYELNDSFFQLRKKDDIECEIDLCNRVQ